MGKLYFVRHGQTVWNVENKICGVTDIPLTPLGFEQAREAGRKLLEQGIRADEILHSPLGRARDTAKGIAEILGVPLREESRLIEQNFGRFEATARNGAEFLEAKKSFATRMGGGESMFRISQRIYNLLDELAAQPDKTFILVAHGGTARVVYSYFHDMTNEEYARFSPLNCEILEFEWPR